MNRGGVTIFFVIIIKGIICRFRLHVNTKIKDAFSHPLFSFCALFRIWQVYIDSPLMDCVYLKSSDTNLSHYFDNSKSYRTFLIN